MVTQSDLDVINTLIKDIDGSPEEEALTRLLHDYLSMWHTGSIDARPSMPSLDLKKSLGVLQIPFKRPRGGAKYHLSSCGRFRACQRGPDWRLLDNETGRDHIFNKMSQARSFAAALVAEEVLRHVAYTLWRSTRIGMKEKTLLAYAAKEGQMLAVKLHLKAEKSSQEDFLSLTHDLFTKIRKGPKLL